MNRVAEWLPYFIGARTAPLERKYEGELVRRAPRRGLFLKQTQNRFRRLVGLGQQGRAGFVEKLEFG